MPLHTFPRWRQIRTVPKDGSLVLAANSRMKIMAVVGWCEDGWTDVGGKNALAAVVFNPNYFDYWQPLPACP
jgi:hypothetical protein